MKKVKAVRKHRECRALEKMIYASGTGSHTPWETGLSRVTKTVNIVRAKKNKTLLQTDTVRRFAGGKKGYEHGLPKTSKEDLVDIGLRKYLR